MDQRFSVLSVYETTLHVFPGRPGALFLLDMQYHPIISILLRGIYPPLYVILKAQKWARSTSLIDVPNWVESLCRCGWVRMQRRSIKKLSKVSSANMTKSGTACQSSFVGFQLVVKLLQYHQVGLALLLSCRGHTNFPRIKVTGHFWVEFSDQVIIIITSHFLFLPRSAQQCCFVN